MGELTRASDLQQQSGSPFDALRRVDDQGEFWSAREIMQPLGYTNWRRFKEAIERGQLALRCDGGIAESNIDPSVNIRIDGLNRRRELPDYRLTREGAYAVVQGGDPRKEEIAEAWSYFRQTVMIAEQVGSSTKSDKAEVISYYAEKTMIAEKRVEQLEREKKELENSRPKPRIKRVLRKEPTFRRFPDHLTLDEWCAEHAISAEHRAAVRDEWVSHTGAMGVKLLALMRDIQPEETFLKYDLSDAARRLGIMPVRKRGTRK